MSLQNHKLIGNDIRRNYINIKRALNLIVDNIDQSSPSDVAYIYNSYAPITVRLIECAAHTSWQSINNILALLPGDKFDIYRNNINHNNNTATPNKNLPTVTDTSMPSSKSFDTFSSTIKLSSDTKSSTPHKSTCIVYFVGGVTTSELAAFRYLNGKLDHNKKYIIAATKLINGNHIIESHSIE